MTYFQQQLLEALGAVALASLLILVTVIMSGCASMFGVPTVPSADIANAVAGSEASCVKFPSPWGGIEVALLGSDKGAIRNGGIKVTCGTTVLEYNAAPVPKPSGTVLP